MFFVYIIQSTKDSKHYIGYTNNLARKLEDHNRGKSPSVRNRWPFVLVYKEEFSTRVEAIQREKQIKKFKGGDAFKQLIKNNTFDPIV